MELLAPNSLPYLHVVVDTSIQVQYMSLYVIITKHSTLLVLLFPRMEETLTDDTMAVHAI